MSTELSASVMTIAATTCFVQFLRVGPGTSPIMRRAGHWMIALRQQFGHGAVFGPRILRVLGRVLRVQTVAGLSVAVVTDARPVHRWQS
jgi:hypothetical protein